MSFFLTEEFDHSSRASVAGAGVDTYVNSLTCRPALGRCMRGTTLKNQVRFSESPVPLLQRTAGPEALHSLS